MRMSDLLSTVKINKTEDFINDKSLDDFFSEFGKWDESVHGKIQFQNLLSSRKAWLGYVGWCQYHGRTDIYSYKYFLNYCFKNDRVYQVESFSVKHLIVSRTWVWVWGIHDEKYRPVRAFTSRHYKSRLKDVDFIKLGSVPIVKTDFIRYAKPDYKGNEMVIKSKQEYYEKTYGNKSADRSLKEKVHKIERRGKK